MPLSRYSDVYGSGPGKALSSMIKRYGPERGKAIFYARVNRIRKRRGGLRSQMGQAARSSK